MENESLGAKGYDVYDIIIISLNPDGSRDDKVWGEVCPKYSVLRARRK